MTHDQASAPPRAALLSVGSELLLGDLTDSNATWLSRQLTARGMQVVHHLAVDDDVARIGEAIEWLAQRSELILVGGGLGPTVDDLTRESVAAVAGVELQFREDLADELRVRFARMGRTMSEQNLRQAHIPVGATVYPAVGTAPAFAIDLAGDTPTRLVALPGVPWEMRELFERHVVDEVRALAGERTTITRRVHVSGRGESDVAAVVEPIVARHTEVTLSFLAHTTGIEVRLTVSASDVTVARATSQPLVDEVVSALGAGVAGIDDERVEEAVLRTLTERGQTVALAESVTAGDIAARLGRIPGASQALHGGMVVYSAEAKHTMLGIPDELLVDGAVGEAVTRALADAVREHTGADWGLAVTGVAGPGDLGEIPVGTVHWALAGPGRDTEVHTRRLNGDRTSIMSRLGTTALDLLLRRLVEDQPGA
ncbi:MAG: CinA family nicotinamide mononucleotide deamidase-related protein [Nitriliruptoraceae bacterium]